MESIQRLKEVKGVAGFHIMAIEWEEKVPEIVETGRAVSAAEVFEYRRSEKPVKINGKGNRNNH